MKILGNKLGGFKLGVIKEAEVFLTRRCNLNCHYCNVMEDDRVESDELSIEQWKKGIDNLENAEIKLVNFFGGEPTIKEGFDELLEYFSKKKFIDYMISTNGLIPPKKVERLLEVGVHNVVVSMDGIFEDVQSPQEKCGHSKFKSYHGFKLLKKFRDAGVQGILGSNFVVSKDTISTIIDTYYKMENENLWMNLCPIQWLKYGKPDKFTDRLTIEDQKEIEEISRELIKIKNKSDNRLVNSVAYLENMADFGIKQNYKCSFPGSLGVIQDGSIWYSIGCNGTLGEQKKYNITNFGKEKMQEFLNDWKNDLKGSACPGCTFSYRDRSGDFNSMSDSQNYNVWYELYESD